MKVKELKNILKDANENDDVFISDADGNTIAIVGAYYSADHECVYVETRQEFPDGWYEKNHEVRWINGAKVIPAPDAVETDDIFYSNRKLGIEEICLTMTFHDGYADDKFGNRMTYPKVGDLTDEQIEEIDRYTGGRVSDSGCVTPNDSCLLYGELVDYGIMDTGNNHNENLVEQINIKWLRYPGGFKPILVALYTRDINEITDADSFHFPDWEEWDEYKHGINTGDWSGYNKRALDSMIENWVLHAENYLMHIADDQDLETIIKFVRCDVCEDDKHS